MENINNRAKRATNKEGRGNTKLPSKQEIQGKHWCFTLNNPTKEEKEQIEIDFSTFCDKWVFGKETGENGTPHFQGYFELKIKDRFSGVKNKFGDRFHFEKMKGTIEQAVKYCIKDGDYIKKGMFPKTYFRVSTRPKLEETILTEEMLFPWQLNIVDIIENPVYDNRSIYWFYENKGKVGKSNFNRYLTHNYNALMIRKGKDSDIMNRALMFEKEFKDIELVVCDIPRAVGNKISTSAIETLKDGMIVSEKYEGGQKLIVSPTILIFSNFFPMTESLSEDRWKIFEIIDNQLVSRDINYSLNEECDDIS